MPKLDLSQIEPRVGSNYPEPYDAPCQNRIGLNLGDPGALTQFGAFLMTLPPGTWSSQRHHHSHADEIVYIVSGHPTLFEGAEGIVLSPGDVTVHPMGDEIGHHMKNETDQDVTFLVVGGRHPKKDHCAYPDIELDLPPNGTISRQYKRKDGTPF